MLRVFVSEERNRRCRRTMEDRHCVVHSFNGHPQQTLCGIFDGHAGTFAAEYAASNIATILSEIINLNPGRDIATLFDASLQLLDQELATVSTQAWSGCTALLVALLNTTKSYQDLSDNTSSLECQSDFSDNSKSGSADQGEASQDNNDCSDSISNHEVNANESDLPSAEKALADLSLTDSSIKDNMDVNKHFTANKDPEATPYKSNDGDDLESEATKFDTETKLSKNNTETSPSDIPLQLVCCNIGDTRAVLCRDGKAIRLSYDHKSSDPIEAARIERKGGTILGGRVNGVLAVTRALGDQKMKDTIMCRPFVLQAPYRPDLDDFIIMACDGLWDVCTDQEAVDLVLGLSDFSESADALVKYALNNFTTDNLTCLVIDLKRNRFYSETKQDLPKISLLESPLARDSNLELELGDNSDGEEESVNVNEKERGRAEDEGREEKLENSLDDMKDKNKENNKQIHDEER